jgi:hypothetical protein
MKVCFVGLENPPVLAREYNHHGIGGEQVQQPAENRAPLWRPRPILGQSQIRWHWAKVRLSGHQPGGSADSSATTIASYAQSIDL